ncbi:MAG: PilZ domain-containing protein [Spongiibacteraceae bacterium]|nr:PilZ domain-containing protein [Spongiibacteraceae bacterium]
MIDYSKRKLERKKLSQPIIITNQISGKDFGELVNITTEGMMLITDKEISTHSIFQLSIVLPCNPQDKETVEVGADCLWCRKVENFHRYWAGFHIIDISAQATQQLENLISHYSK